MTRGRKPKPTSAKKLAGNPGKRRLDADEPQYDRASDALPDHLSAPAKAEYLRLSNELVKTGVLTVVDVGTLEAYCEAYATWITSKAEAVKRPVILNSRGDSAINPQLRIANMAVQQMIKLASEMGITPASRARIKPPKSEEENELTKFLRETVR